MLKIGIDVGGTTIKGGVVDDKGEVLFKGAIDTKVKADDKYEDILNRMVEFIDKLRDEAKEKYPNEKIDAIGIGIPGIVRKGYVVNAPNIGWKNIPLKEDIEEKTGLPVTLINDATAAAVAENRFGASKGKKDAAMYTLGTGVGGGLIINGSVVGGAHGVASEFGHILHEPNFYSCNCGKNGCLETYSSATGLINRYKHEVEQGKSTKQKIENPTAKDVIDLAREEDEAALAAFNVMTDQLALNISNMIDILDPEIFVIGGGVSHAGDFLFNTLKDKVAKNITFKEVVGEPNIVPAEFGNDAGIVGAAYSGEYI